MSLRAKIKELENAIAEIAEQEYDVGDDDTLEAAKARLAQAIATLTKAHKELEECAHDEVMYGAMDVFRMDDLKKIDELAREVAQEKFFIRPWEARPKLKPPMPNKELFVEAQRKSEEERAARKEGLNRAMRRAKGKL